MLTLYSKKDCIFCIQAVKLLKSKGIPFNEVKIDEDAAAKEFVISKGHRTVPQLYEDGKLYVEGGFQGLQAKLKEEYAH